MLVLLLTSQVVRQNVFSRVCDSVHRQEGLLSHDQLETYPMIQCDRAPCPWDRAQPAPEGPVKRAQVQVDPHCSLHPHEAFCWVKNIVFRVYITYLAQFPFEALMYL